MSTPDSKTDVYQQYLLHERTEGDPARVQCLFERAIAELCLDAALWLEYVQYLDTQLKMDTVVISACERAVRNCPWSSPLWQYYLRVLERYQTPHNRVKEVMEQALAVGFSMAEDYRNLWLAYLDYLRRIIKWDKKDVNEDEITKELRATYNRACEHLAQYFGLNGDPTCTVLQSWARMEAIHGRDMEATRRLWNDIMSQGHDRMASMWLEYISLEKCYGDTKHLRRLYQRALHSVQDWPESVGDAWLNFERDEGTLESFEACEVKYKASLVPQVEVRAGSAQPPGSQGGGGCGAGGAAPAAGPPHAGRRQEEGQGYFRQEEAGGGREVGGRGSRIDRGEDSVQQGRNCPAHSAKGRPSARLQGTAELQRRGTSAQESQKDEADIKGDLRKVFPVKYSPSTRFHASPNGKRGETPPVGRRS